MDTSYIITINAGTTIDFGVLFSQTQVCPGEIVDFTATPPDGIDVDYWSFQSDMGQLWGCPNSSSISSGFYSNAGFQDVTIMANYNGCTSDTTISNAIEVLGPVGHFYVEYECEDPMAIECVGNITGATEWLYEFGDGNSANSNSNQNVNHIYANTGDYTIKLTSIASTGCDPFVETFEIHIRDVEAEFSVDTNQLCQGSALTLSSVGSQDVNPFCNEGYLWLFENEMNLVPYRTETNQTVINVDQSGIYTLQLVVEDINGCRDTASLDISVFGIDIAIDTLVQNYCIPFEVDFSGIVDADLEIDTWFWDFGDGLTSTEASPNHVFNTIDPPVYTITALVTDTMGCSNIDSITVAPDIPVAEFSVSDDEICVGENTILTADSLNYENYEWGFGDNQTGDSVTTNHTYNAGGIYDLQLIVTNDKGCTDTLLVIGAVEVQENPIAGYSTDVDTIDNYCYPILINFSDTSIAVPFGYRVWDLGTGFPVIDAQTVGNTYDQPDIYTVSLKVGTTFGCEGYFERDFIVEGPVADFSLSDAHICLYDSINLNIIDSVDVAYFSWDFGDGIDSANISPITYIYPQVPFGGSTIIQLIYWSTDSICSASTQYPISINETIAGFNRNLNGSFEDTVLCFGIEAQFTNLSIDATNYQWDFGDSTFSTNSSPNYNYPSGGAYLVKLIASNRVTLCYDTIIKQLTIFDEMIVSAPDQLTCEQDTLFLEASGGETYQWFPADVVSDPTISNPFIINNQDNDLEVLITDTNDCNQRLFLNASFIYSPPIPEWTDTTILYGEIIDFQYPVDEYHNYIWTVNGDDNCEDCSDFIFPENNSYYQLIVTNDFGCKMDTFYFKVFVLSDLAFWIPNAFSPDNDDINDFFYPVFDRALDTGYEFSIYNRGGQLIWKTDDITQKWDGSSSLITTDNYAEPSVYIWMLTVRDLKGILNRYNGTVLLIR